MSFFVSALVRATPGAVTIRGQGFERFGKKCRPVDRDCCRARDRGQQFQLAHERGARDAVLDIPRAREGRHGHAGDLQRRPHQRRAVGRRTVRGLQPGNGQLGSDRHAAAERRHLQRGTAGAPVVPDAAFRVFIPDPAADRRMGVFHAPDAGRRGRARCHVLRQEPREAAERGPGDRHVRGRCGR